MDRTRPQNRLTTDDDTLALKERIEELERSLAEAQRRTASRSIIYDRAIETFRGAKICAWHWSKETEQIEYFPKNAGDVLGLPAGQLPSTDAANLVLIHPEDRERVAEMFQRANRDGESYWLEYRVILQDGSLHHLQEASEPLYDQDGRFIGNVGTWQDVTELKTAEKALRESEDRLSQAATLAKLGHWVWDELADKVTYCSDEMAHILGLETGEELLPSLSSPSAHLDWIHPEDRERYADAADGSEFAERGMDIEYRVVTQSGQVRHVREIAEPEHDEEGRLVRSKGTLQDITREKQAEIALRESEERYALAIRGSHDGIWDWDIENREIHLSQRVKEIIDLHDHCEKLPETQILSLMHPDDRPEFRDRLTRHLKGETEYFTCEFRVLAEDGSIRWILDRGFALRDDTGRAYRMAGSVSDITERRQTEEKLRQAQKMEAIGQLTGGIAHDFNNILGVVLGNLDLASEKLADESIAVHINQAIQAAERGAELTERLLAFARRQTLRPVALRVDDCLDGMRDLLRQAVGTGVTVRVTATKDLWACRADPLQFENAILNVVINARDAMPDGGNLEIASSNVEVDFDLAETLEIRQGEYVLIEVTDDGAGMSEDVRLRAFDPFFTTKDVGKGSGLGLSMVQGFVQQSGGSVSLLSCQDDGTSLRIYLPRNSRVQAARFEAGTSKSGIQSRSPNVLVALEDDSLRAVVMDLLDGLGCRVFESTCEDETQSSLDSQMGLDLLLTDVRPYDNGRLLRLEKSIESQRPALPVIYLTDGDNQPQLPTETRQAERILLKRPLDSSDLSRVIQQALPAS